MHERLSLLMFPLHSTYITVSLLLFYYRPQGKVIFSQAFVCSPGGGSDISGPRSFLVTGPMSFPGNNINPWHQVPSGGRGIPGTRFLPGGARVSRRVGYNLPPPPRSVLILLECFLVLEYFLCGSSLTIEDTSMRSALLKLTEGA